MIREEFTVAHGKVRIVLDRCKTLTAEQKPVAIFLASMAVAALETGAETEEEKVLAKQMEEEFLALEN